MLDYTMRKTPIYKDDLIYFPDNDTWIVPRTQGSVVEGGFGHSSVYDPISKLIYVYGGYHAGETSSDQLSDKLFSFDITTRFW